MWLDETEPKFVGGSFFYYFPIARGHFRGSLITGREILIGRSLLVVTFLLKNWLGSFFAPNYYYCKIDIFTPLIPVA